MERLKLEILPREGRGKSVTRKLRAKDEIPGVVYGSGIDPTPVTTQRLALARVLRGGANALVDLVGAKSIEGKPVLVKEIQRDPLSRKVVHFDLYAVNLQARLDIEVPLIFVGVSKGVAARRRRDGAADAHARGLVHAARDSRVVLDRRLEPRRSATRSTCATSSSRPTSSPRSTATPPWFTSSRRGSKRSPSSPLPRPPRARPPRRPKAPPRALPRPPTKKAEE